MPITIQRDIPYAEAGIGFNEGRGPLRRQPLLLDAYLPEEGRVGRPALVLAFGGAFHRGSKETDSFTVDGHTSTAMAEYCARFAELGFACFSVQYRLTQSDPDPGTTPVLTDPEATPLARIAVVRTMLGLPPIGVAAAARAVEAAIDDVAAAARFVIAQAPRFGVDPARVVLGGWSAGARAATYACHAEGVPVAGVVNLSGPMGAADLGAYVRPGAPPLLLFTAERDFDYILAAAPPMVARFEAVGVPVRWRRVPGCGHAYPAEALTNSGRSVQAEIAAVLSEWVGATPTAHHRVG